MKVQSNKKESAVKIALIDTLVDTKTEEFGECIREQYMYGLNVKDRVYRERSDVLTSMHGTSVTRIIYEVCSHVEIDTYGIVDESMKSDGRILVKALEDAVNGDYDVIHLSCGTKRLRYVLKLWSLSRNSIKKGTIIVAASANGYEKIYPAFNREVIGVVSAKALDGKKCRPEYLYLEEVRKHIKNPLHYMFDFAYSSCAAAAVITGYVSQCVCNNRDLSFVDLRKKVMEFCINNFSRSI